MKRKFTPKAEHVLRQSAVLAGELGHTYIGSEHLLLALAEETDSVAACFLESHAADGGKLRRTTADYTGEGTPTTPTPQDMTPTLRRILERAATEPRAVGAPVGTEQLLLALLSEEDAVGGKLLAAVGVNTAELRAELEGFATETEGSARGGRAKGKDISAFAYLGQYGHDLNEQARAGKQDPLIGREEEIAHVMRILCRRSKNNPCLIGEPGVGKTAIAEGLAARIVQGRVPEVLKGKTVVSLDLSALLAGAKYRGEFEDRMRGVLEEVKKDGELILFIDELHTIVGAGAAEGAIDAANILKPALARGELHLIGATTVKEYRLHIEKDAALCRRFEQVSVEEPSPAEAERILLGLAERYGAHHRLLIEKDAVAAAVRLSVRYLPERYLPDKALDLLDEAAADVRMTLDERPDQRTLLEQRLQRISEEKLTAIRTQRFEEAAALRDEERTVAAALRNEKTAKSEPPPTLTAEAVARTLARRTGIPTDELFLDEGESPAQMSARLRERIVGQDEAIEAVVRAICRRRAGVGDPHRPVGCFLFLGATGVGKTALARALAECLFGGESALCRLDMSEYMERHSISRLIGAPPGYIGHEEGGALIERIRRRPYSVILFDEIEKAHPDVYNVLLQMMEDGRLTDSLGRTADLSHALIILTSNIGGERREHAVGFTASDKNETRSDELRHVFRPELLNRLDEIIRFRTPTQTDLVKIARRLIGELAERLAEGGTALRVTDEAVAQLCARCRPAEYGARELRRLIAREIEGEISAALLSGKLSRGNAITVCLRDGALTLTQENNKGTEK